MTHAFHYDAAEKDPAYRSQRDRARGRHVGAGLGPPWRKTPLPTTPGDCIRRPRAIDGGDETIVGLEMIVGFDDDLAGEATRVANRLHDLLTQTHPSLERVLGHLGPQLQHPAVLALLERFGSPAQIRKAGRRRAVTLLRPKAPRMAERLFEEIFSALDDQTGHRSGHRGGSVDRPEPDRLADGRA